MMGFFSSLFGGGKKAEAPKKEKAVPAAAPVATEAPAGASVVAADGVPPEVVAAISASINAIMNDDAEMIAAVTAAIIHAQGGAGVRAISIKRTGNPWAAAGRTKIMDSRQMF